MKIVFCLNHYLPYHLAGTEVYVHALSKALVQQGVELLVVVPNFDKEVQHEYIHEGIRVIQYAENTQKTKAIYAGKKAPDGLVNFRKILVDEKPDFIHYHELGGSAGFGLYHLELGKELDIKQFVTFHFAVYSCATGNLLYKETQPCDGKINISKCTACVIQQRSIGGSKAAVLETANSLFYKLGVDATQWPTGLGTALGLSFSIKKLKEKLHKIVALSEHVFTVADWYRLVLLKNGIPASKLTSIPQGLPQIVNITTVKQASEKVRLIFIGRITPVKGLDVLIKAMEQVPNEKIELDVYGQATDEAYVSACKALIKKSTVRWQGILPGNEVVNKIAVYDALCLPSSTCEMSPLVIQEAFAAGVPIIASDVLGNREQIDDGENGWLFPFKDDRALAKLLTNLSEDLNVLTSANQLSYVAKDFDWIALQYQKEYSGII